MIAAIVIAVGLAAPAHQVGFSRGAWSASGRDVKAELVFARAEVAPLAGDPLASIAVTSGGAPCEGLRERDEPTEQDGHAWHLSWTCPQAGVVDVELGPLFAKLSPDHRHVAELLAGGEVHDAVVSARASSFAFGAEPSLLSFLEIGVEHILFGFDHLVFLFGLLLVGGRVRSMLAIVTAFTAAHSVTLALATLGVFAPPPLVVEPLIALSIAYVGVENLVARDLSQRWRLAALFGLVHGFGFAGALAEVGLPRDRVPAVLLLFNLGVELGQLAVLALALPLLRLLEAKGVLGPRAKHGLSFVVIALGLFWLAERVADAVG